jgi:hypothetical protein
MFGEDSAPHIEKARVKLELESEPDDSVFLLGGDPIPEEAPKPTWESSTTDEEDPSGDTPEPQGAGGVGGIEVDPQPPSEPGKPREPIKRKIGVSLKAGVSHKERSVADAGLCQQVAFWFEESEGQGGFPKMVDYFTGTDAPGCDILSFASEEACERYKESGDETLVERFIEVKGRSASRGKVFFEGNELESARRRHEKFYIYRVFDAGDGTFEVAILSDPLRGPTRVAHEVDVFGALGPAQTTFERIPPNYRWLDPTSGSGLSEPGTAHRGRFFILAFGITWASWVPRATGDSMARWANRKSMPRPPPGYWRRPSPAATKRRHGAK